MSSDFKCIQGLITLFDVENGDATLACWPESHKHHEDFGKKFNLNKSFAQGGRGENQYDYQEFGGDKPKTEYLKSLGLSPCCVEAKAGSLVLWDSRTVHQAIQSV